MGPSGLGQETLLAPAPWGRVASGLVLEGGPGPDLRMQEALSKGQGVWAAR